MNITNEKRILFVSPTVLIKFGYFNKFYCFLVDLLIEINKKFSMNQDEKNLLILRLVHSSISDLIPIGPLLLQSAESSLFLGFVYQEISAIQEHSKLVSRNIALDIFWLQTSIVDFFSSISFNLQKKRKENKTE